MWNIDAGIGDINEIAVEAYREAVARATPVSLWGIRTVLYNGKYVFRNGEEGAKDLLRFALQVDGLKDEKVESVVSNIDEICFSMFQEFAQDKTCKPEYAMGFAGKILKQALIDQLNKA